MLCRHHHSSSPYLFSSFVFQRLIFGCRVSFAAWGISSLSWEGFALGVAHWLICSKAWGILVPQPRIKPRSSALEGRFLIQGPLGKSQFFSLCKLETLHPLNTSSPFPPLQPLAPTGCFFMHDLTVYGWNHTACVCPCLAYFTECHVLKVRQCGAQVSITFLFKPE